MQAAFPAAKVIGCSTAGEIITGQMLKNSVVAMAMDAEVFSELEIAVVEGLSGDVVPPTQAAFAEFEKSVRTPMKELPVEDYVGIVLADGLSGGEERLMDAMGDLTNVIFVGGSAGDDMRFQATYVYANGQAYRNAAVLALTRPKRGFDFIKTQSFCSLPRTFVATRVDEARREILEFDNRPAAEVYAEAVGTSPEKLSEAFMRNPVGLLVGDDIYVRSPFQCADNRKISFFCAVKEGMQVSLLESQDIIHDTRQAIEAKKKELGRISGIIDFHCILRTLELEKEGRGSEYGPLFAGIPMIGFSTYGEQFLGHVNQTSTMLVLK